jgi:hypothetical protein
MHPLFISKPAAIFVLILTLTSLGQAEPKVEEEVVGPAPDQDAKYVVSPNGGHLATVGHKGSRMVVTVDGVAGPKVDDVITPVLSWIDVRYQERVPPEEQGYTSPKPVTFSKKGNHYAYVARIGQEWVLMEDNKELLRMPAGGIVGGTSGIAGSAGNTDIRLQFGGEDGKHLYLARSSFAGFELWMDGQKLPGYYFSGGGGSAGTMDPLISSDGNHIAYIATLGTHPGDKQTVFFDGKDTGYYADNLQLSPDGLHVLGLGKEGNAQTLLVDGKPLMKAQGIIRFYVASVGSHLAVVTQKTLANGNIGQVLLVHGKPVEGTLCEQIPYVTFSPDGKRFAALCTRSGAQWMVVDGKKGQEYQMIDQPISGMKGVTGPTFSPDSAKFGYSAMMGQKKFIVIDEDESDAYEGNASFKWTPDGKHLICQGYRNGGSVVTIDNKPQRVIKGFNMDTFVAAPDFSHYAYSDSNGRDPGQIVIDGKEAGISGLFSYSPDFQHLVIVGYRAQDGKSGIFVDGKFVAPNLQAIPICTFSADSQHLYWMSVEPNTGPDKDKDAFAAVIYCDGKAVARCQRSGPAQSILFPMGFVQSLKPKPAWLPNPDGTFTVLAPTEDGVKRHKVTAPDTTLATLAADADAAEAKAKEKAKPRR